MAYNKLRSSLRRKRRGCNRSIGSEDCINSGRSKSEKKAIKTQFKELYSFRSDLVHGNRFKKQTYVGHLHDARKLSRRVILWFLHCLCRIQADFVLDPTVKNIPTREDILSVLDLDQNRRIHLRRLIDILPSGFPFVGEWVK